MPNFAYFLLRMQATYKLKKSINPALWETVKKNFTEAKFYVVEPIVAFHSHSDCSTTQTRLCHY